MSAGPLLTIGIPTYNRADSVMRRVRELLTFRDELGVRILVIDNASTDGTATRLQEEFADSDVAILRNDENVGYAGNLLRLIEVADTEYLTVVSDEDRVERAGLSTLLTLLDDRHPRLVSPRARVGNDDCYRGRRRTGPIDPEDFESASFYVSGLTMAVSPARQDARAVGALLSVNAAARFYPQVLLTALAILDGESLFLDALVSTQVDEHPTQISSAGPGAYWFVPGRWAQFEGFEEFFSDVAARSSDSQAAVDRMRGRLRSGVMGLLEAAAIAQFPDLAAQLRRDVPTSWRGRVRALLGRG